MSNSYSDDGVANSSHNAHIAATPRAPAQRHRAEGARLSLARVRRALRLGATKMDGPEWIAVDPLTKEVYCTLKEDGGVIGS